MKLIDFFCPNEQELQRLSGRPTTTREDVLLAARALLTAEGPGAVLVTLGPRGALLVTHEEVLEVAAFPASVVDATAAGDAFRAAFAVALAEGQVGPSRVRRAIKVAQKVPQMSKEITRGGGELDGFGPTKAQHAPAFSFPEMVTTCSASCCRDLIGGALLRGLYVVKRVLRAVLKERGSEDHVSMLRLEAFI